MELSTNRANIDQISTFSHFCLGRNALTNIRNIDASLKHIIFHISKFENPENPTFWKRRAPRNREESFNEILKILGMRSISPRKHEWNSGNMVPISFTKHEMKFGNLIRLVFSGSIFWKARGGGARNKQLFDWVHKNWLLRAFSKTTEFYDGAIVVNLE